MQETAAASTISPVLSPFLQVGIVGALCLVLFWVVRYLFREMRTAQKECEGERKGWAAEKATLIEQHKTALAAVVDAEKLKLEQKHRELAEKFAASLDSLIKTSAEDQARARAHFGDIIEAMSAEHTKVNTKSVETIDRLVDRIVPKR